MEPMIPVLLLLALLWGFAGAEGQFFTPLNVASLLRAMAEFALIALAMGLTVISGGVDLSVGSMLSFSTMVALLLLKVGGLPPAVVVLASVGFGALMGSVNGIVIGYLKARPFLVTLVTLLVYRGIVDILDLRFATALAPTAELTPLWAWLGRGSVIGLPTGLFLALLIYLVAHIMLSRSRLGWHITAIGSSRRAARHAGIPVERVLFLTYTMSGALVGTAGVLLAARLDSASSRLGEGVEIAALTAVVLGGISLSGGRGTAARALIGAAVVSVLRQGLILMNLPGEIYTALLAGMLILVVGIDFKWNKNRGKAIQKIRIDPTTLEYGAIPDFSPGSGSPYAQNDALVGALPIGLGEVEGPEDVIVDRAGRVYCDDRRGRILRFSGENFEHKEIFAKTGGGPFGMAFDAEDNLVVCVGGMGLYSCAPDGNVSKLTDETPRNWLRLSDDSRLRLADDVDVVPDGRIFFSEATTRFELAEWVLDSIEGRPNGRLLCYDPKTGTTRTVVKNIVFANGVCSCHDGESLLLASTWLCKIFRYWHSGRRAGQMEVFIDNLPGYVDNINRASDGTYWVALNGLRSPTFDLAMRMPSFRRRMIKQVPPDEWLYPSLNHGCIVKVDDDGEPVESLWDPTTDWHPSITSMREHDGHLYIGGLHNNRVGRIKLPGSDTVCRCGQEPCATAARGNRDGTGSVTAGMPEVAR